MRKIISILIVATALALITRLFILDGFIVSGDSMYPTIVSGDYVLVSKISYVGREPKMGDIVVATTYAGQRVVKRVSGLPGERVEWDGGFITLDPKEYFLLGDNREVSLDSREEGPVNTWDIEGRVVGVFNLKTLQYKSFR